MLQDFLFTSFPAARWAAAYCSEPCCACVSVSGGTGTIRAPARTAAGSRDVRREEHHRARLVHRTARTLGLVDRLSRQGAAAFGEDAVPDDRDLRLDRLGQAHGHRRL